jgi:hypothetical protein
VRRARGQQGAALIMIIGVVAALAVLASTLVLLTVNAAGNTGRDRGRAQAFNVTEGLIDYSLSQLGKKWPVSAAPTIDTAAFVAQFNTGAAAGNFTISNPSVTVTVTFFDNVDTDRNGVINRIDGVPYDQNGDGLIYMEAQATVNNQKARIQVEAKKSILDTKIRHGIAVATDSNIYSNNSKGSVGCTPPNGVWGNQQQLLILAGGTIDPTAPDPQLEPNGTLVPTPNYPGSATDSVVAPAILQSLIASAKMGGTWYSDIPAENAKGALPIPSDPTTLTGLVVIETLAPNQVRLDNNATMNGDGQYDQATGQHAPPGIFIVIGPHTFYPNDSSQLGVSGGIETGGTVNFYGLMYTDGDITGAGTMNVIGMALAKGSIDLKGARRVDYNDNVVTNLNKIVQVGAQVVPDTWRQIQPTPLP